MLQPTRYVARLGLPHPHLRCAPLCACHHVACPPVTPPSPGAHPQDDDGSDPGPVSRTRTRKARTTSGAHSFGSSVVSISAKEARLSKVLEVLQLQLRCVRTGPAPPCTP